jgi:hypothetical protein
MDDPLSSIGLTAVTLYQVHSSSIDVLIKRPYKNTLTYHRVSSASYSRLVRLARSRSAELVQVPNSGEKAYFLFYWQKQYPILSDFQYPSDMDRSCPSRLYPT